MDNVSVRKVKQVITRNKSSDSFRTWSKTCYDQGK